MGKTIGRIAGLALFAGAAAAVWLWPEGAATVPPVAAVRPVKSTLVTRGNEIPALAYSGQVKATDSRVMAFKQAGRIERLPIAKGKAVKKGEKLAWLDARDFENRLAQAEAAVKRDRLTFGRLSEAAKKNAVSQEEVSAAETRLHHSEAEVELARRALSETVLVAPFDGEIADVPATELDMVTPQTPILTVHNTSLFDIEVAVPETMVIRMREIDCGDTNSHATVVFDSCPDRRYPVTFSEYAATADKRNQTYLATYRLKAPKDLFILPGMSATVRIENLVYRGNRAADYAVIPESAVGQGADGGSFVWLLTPDPAAEGVFRATARAIKVVNRFSTGVFVSEGLAGGERIATAGISVIAENQRVRLLK